MEGIGVRIDGAANRDLDPGAIIALAPGLEGSPNVAIYESWGPGYFDPRFNQDGMNFPVLIPPIYGLADVPYETYTGDGPISYWNSYVGITQMGGIGNFFDPRIDVAVAYDRDMIAAKLPALFEYEVSLEAPAPDDDAFDAAAAERGQALFESATATCSTCHTGPALSDSGMALHAPEETGMDPTTAERSATGMYRTTPLRALLAHPPYFHDGSAETLADVVDHYDTTLDLGLTDAQKGDLVEYLNSL
jgi:mono/diheme cytochrome c family protein